MTTLSIIILSYNTADLTLKCLKSIQDQYKKQFKSGEFEIIVVDNASSDTSVSEISNIQFQISNFKLNRLVFCAFIFVVIINFLYYIHGYYAHYPKQYSGEWEYGYKDAISYIKSVEKNYDRIYFTEALGRPYVYFLFYTNYSPEEFRKSSIVEREVLGFVHVNGFDKYRFAKNITGDNESGRKILYIDVPNNVPANANVKKEFYLLNGEKVLIAYIL